MKIQKNSTLKMGAKLTILLFFVFVVTNAQAKVFDLYLKVNASQSALEISDAPTKHECDHANAKKGCLRVRKNKKGDIGFRLEDKVKCGENDEGYWELTDVYLGGKNHADKPGTGTNPVDWGKLDVEVQKDFEVANYSTGRLKLRKRSTSGQLIRIYDQNESTTGYFIYYRVEAMCIANDLQIAGPIVSDPRIVNEGEPET